MAFISSSCGKYAAPNIADQAVTTPNYYTENKILFATDTDASQMKRKLQYTYEVDLDSDSEVKELSPVGCILRGVRLPETKELEKAIDVAVVLDIVTAGSESLTSLVVFYQRNVKGGQMLNFQDLLVYYDPIWDGVTPPYFRLRLLDVKSERNRRTQEFLDNSSKLSGALNGVVPHPVIPGVRTAIEASKLIFGNKKNKVLLDYQVQFYSPAQIVGADSRLTPLRKGEWIVIGREKGADSNFWLNQVFLNQRTGKLLNQSGKILKVPYVSLALMSAEATIPKHIMDRSQLLVELLSSTERRDFDALTSATQKLANAANLYSLEQRLMKFKTKSDFVNLVDALINNAGNQESMSVDEERSAIRLINKFLEDKVDDVSSLTSWWASGADQLKMEDTIDIDQFEFGKRWN